MPLGRRGPGLVRGVARTAAVVGTATAVSGKVAHHQNEKYAEQDQAQYDQQQAAAAPPPAAPAEPDYMAELEKLAQLRDQGVISQADYDAKKKQVLGI